MNDKVKKEVEKLIKRQNLNCSIEEFKDKADWYFISIYQYLSENFIREFQDKVDWIEISRHQKLSTNFIIEFKNKLDLENMLFHNKITQNFYNNLKYHKVRRYEILDI